MNASGGRLTLGGLRGLYCAASAVAALGGLAIAAPGAFAVAFGANLNAPVVSGAPSCGALQQPSCLGFNLSTSFAPHSGVATAVRVKVGAVTGPMQVVVLRQYYQNNPLKPGTPNLFCCFLQEYGPTFTPKPNRITTIPTALGMVEQPAPLPGDFNTVSRADFLALSVLNSTTPVPLGRTASGNALAFYYAPAPHAPNDPPAPSPNGLSGSLGAGTAGYFLLMNADLDTNVARNPVSVPGTGTFSATSSGVPLFCRLTTTCRGTLTLQDRAGRTAADARAHILGSKKFTIGSGRQATVQVSLTRAGRSFVKGRRRVTVHATATLGKTHEMLKITLRR